MRHNLNQVIRLKISIDTDTDSFDASISAVHAAYGIPYKRHGDWGDGSQLDFDDDDDADDLYTREDLEAMSLAELKGLAKDAGYQASEYKGLNDAQLIDWLLGEEEVDFFPGKWNRKRIRKLARWVHGGDAAEALRFIATNAPAVALDDALAHMANYTGISGFNGQHMGGRMSSVGFAQNSIGGGVGDIYDTDYKHRMYRMDKGIAKVLLEELDSLDQ